MSGGWPKGRRHTPEECLAIKKAMDNSPNRPGRPTGTPMTPEQRLRHSLSRRGRKLSEQARINMRVAASTRKPRGHFTKRKHSAETIAKLSDGRNRHKWTDAQRQAHSLRLKGKSTSVSIGQKRTIERLLHSGCKVFQRGWPDLLIVEPNGRVYAIEVKRPGGDLTKDQIGVISLLRSIGLHVEVVYESNQETERIEP